MKNLKCFFALLLIVLLPASLPAQQVKDLFNQERSAALYFDCVTPYQSAIKLLKEIDSPANSQLKQNFEQLFQTTFQNFGKARSQARTKACMANMRVLLGGVEMYNMDHVEMIDKQLDIQKLVDGRYVKSVPLCPDGGVYSNRGDLSVDGQIQCSIHGTVENPIYPPEKNLQEAMNLETLIKKFLEFDQNALFRPTGGLYVVFEPYSSGGFAILVEAESKPEQFITFLRETMQINLPEAENGPDGAKIVNYQVSPLGGAKKLKLVFSSKGLYVDALMGSDKGNPEHWQNFQTAAAKPENSLVIEVLPAPIIKQHPAFRSISSSGSSSKACSANMRVLLGACEMFNMDAANGQEMHQLDPQKLLDGKYLRSVPQCPNGGTYSQTGDLMGDGQIVCSIHNTADNLKIVDLPADPSSPQEIVKKIQVLRLIIGQKNSLLGAGLTDQKALEALKAILQQQIPVLKQQMMNLVEARLQQTGVQLSQSDQNSIAILKGFVNSLDVFHKGTWTGIRAQGIPGNHLIAPAVGVLAAIAVPNFRKARENARQKACYANQRVLMGAMEMYSMDNPEPMRTLNMKALFDGKYLRSEVQCPDGGEYSAELDSEGNYRVKCTVHGSVD